MKFIEFSGGYIGDTDNDGNVEVAVSDVRIFGAFNLGNLKVELPTAIVANFLIAAGRTLGVPVLELLGLVLGKK